MKQKQQYRRDLTEGNILRNLLIFSIPLLIGNVLQSLYSVVDGIMVGNFIDEDALGAIVVSFPIIFVLISFVMGFTMATTVLVSQFAGANNKEMVIKTINNSLLILSISAIIISIIGFIFGDFFLRLINTPDEIFGYASDYLRFFFIGLVFMFGYNVLSAILRGLGDSYTPLLFLIISTVINIALNFILIRGVGPIPSFGIRGAALATIISQTISFFIALIYLSKKNSIINFKFKYLKFNKELTIKTLKIGLPSSIQQIVVSLGFLLMTFFINSFGSKYTTAFGSANKIDGFAHMPAMSLGIAVSTLTGQNIGAKKMDNVKEIYKWGCIMAAAITGAIMVFVLIAPTLILRFFNSDPEFLSIGSEYLRIVSLSYIPLSLMFVTTGVLRGAGDTLPTMIISIISLWIFRIPLAWYLSFRVQLGANGIVIAIVISSMITLLLSYGYYRTNRWKKEIIPTPKLKTA